MIRIYRKDAIVDQVGETTEFVQRVSCRCRRGRVELFWRSNGLSSRGGAQSPNTSVSYGLVRPKTTLGPTLSKNDSGLKRLSVNLNLSSPNCAPYPSGNSYTLPGLLLAILREVPRAS